MRRRPSIHARSLLAAVLVALSSIAVTASAVLAEIDAETFPHGAVWLAAMMASHHLAAGDLDAPLQSLLA